MRLLCLVTGMAAAAAAARAAAQDAARGVVRDADGLAVAGAELRGVCAGVAYVRVSGAAGEFGLPCAGRVRVTATGFAALETEAAAVLLLQAAVAAEQVTATATRGSVAVGAGSRTEYALTGRMLEDYPAVTLDDSLRQHAGFELFRRAPSRVANPTSEGVSLRGLGSTAASRTLVLADGVPLNDAFGGWVHWNEIPQVAVAGVQLVSGGSSDLYGSSALGGVIELETARARPARAVLTGAGGAQDTVNLQALGSASAGWLDGLAAGENLRTAGYVPVDPAVAGAVDTPANVRSQAYRLELGRRSRPARRVFAAGNVLNEDRGNGTPLQTNATRLWRYVAGYETPEGTVVGARVRGFGSEEGYRQSFSAIAADRGSESLTRLQRVRTQELGATGDVTLSRGRAGVVIGGDVRDLRGRDDETPFVRGMAGALQAVSARQRFAGGFMEGLGSAAGWSGAASLRVDYAANLDTVQRVGAAVSAPADCGEVILSPRAGMTRALGSRGEVWGSGFRAFRAPTMNELYRTGQVGQETTLANAALESERATGWEAGARVHGGGVSWQTAYFWTEINRPVSAVPVSQMASAIVNQRQNLGQIRSRGVETELTFGAGRRISGQVGYQFARATVTAFAAQPALVGNWLPQVPRHAGTAQLRLVSGRLGEVTVAARGAGVAYDDAANRFPLAGYFTLSVAGVRSLGSHVDLLWQVENLTGARAQVARTPVLTLGSPVYGQAGLRLRLGGVR